MTYLAQVKRFDRKKRKSDVSRDRKIYDSCANNAPYFAYQIEGKRYGVVQGCCNDWNCPRCGQQRAREEYGRIVSGAREIAKTTPLYFFTVTCDGEGLSYEDAEQGYLSWTNSLLTKCRAEAKRSNKLWAYAAVTERQKRGHPHTHYITTYCPADASPIAKGEGKTYITSGEVFPAKHNTLQSFSLERKCVQSGLGRMYDISAIENIEGASRYAAKYLFKETVFSTVWPKGWKRIRYSQNWPKLPEITGDAFILLTNFDWYRLGRLAVTIKTKDDGVANVVRRKLSHMDVIVA